MFENYMGGNDPRWRAPLDGGPGVLGKASVRYALPDEAASQIQSAANARQPLSVDLLRYAEGLATHSKGLAEHVTRKLDPIMHHVS